MSAFALTDAYLCTMQTPTSTPKEADPGPLRKPYQVPMRRPVCICWPVYVGFRCLVILVNTLMHLAAILFHV
jgi:hypothetical protein